jgi:hypothetical protein
MVVQVVMEMGVLLLVLEELGVVVADVTGMVAMRVHVLQVMAETVQMVPLALVLPEATDRLHL